MPSLTPLWRVSDEDVFGHGVQPPVGRVAVVAGVPPQDQRENWEVDGDGGGQVERLDVAVAGVPGVGPVPEQATLGRDRVVGAR